jgi:tripartite-type tricarboxylate transporter receptor subunit TctC
LNKEEQMKFLIACIVTMAASVIGLTGQSLAQKTYPTKPVRVIVPFPPGEAADVIARLVSPVLSERMGQQFLVDNRPGVAGQLGLGLLRAAPPDGYTIGMGQGGNLSVAPHTNKKVPYDALKDFAAIALNATNYLAVVAHPSVPFKTGAEMIEWAKKNPGKLTLATNGEGGYPHLAFEYLASLAGFKFLHVPYKGAAQILPDVMGGQVMAAIGSYTSMAPHAQAGKLTLLGVTNHMRVADNPNLPVFADIVPGYDMRGWFGVVGPAGMPREVVQRLNAEINRAMKLPEINAKLVAAGLIVANESPEFFEKFLRTEYEKYGKLVREIGLQPR